MCVEKAINEYFQRYQFITCDHSLKYRLLYDNLLGMFQLWEIVDKTELALSNFLESNVKYAKEEKEAAKEIKEDTKLQHYIEVCPLKL